MLALPGLLYGSELWTIKGRDVRRITAAEMKYMRKKEDTFGKITQKNYKELSLTAVLDKM